MSTSIYNRVCTCLELVEELNEANSTENGYLVGNASEKLEKELQEMKAIFIHFERVFRFTKK